MNNKVKQSGHGKENTMDCFMEINRKFRHSGYQVSKMKLM